MKKIIIILILFAASVFAWWTLSPLFITVEQNDAMPTSLASEVFRDDVFPISDTRGHPATGNVRVTKTETGTTVRYENYDGTNGPDLFVYLAKDLDAKEFVSFGRARGNKGNINYEVPEGIDVSEYRYVMTWCKAFGVLFDYAEIN